MTDQFSPPFRRSSFCNGGGCVEVTTLPDGRVALRDSKDLTVPQHFYTSAEWTAFILGAKAGEFDFSPVDHEVRSPHS